MEKNPIIGIWSLTQDEMTIFYEFKKDKTGRFFAPKIFNTPLCYNITEKTLTIAIDKQSPVTANYRIEANKLIVTADNGQEFEYIKQ